MIAEIAHNLDPAHQMAVQAGSGSPGQLTWLDSGPRKRFVFMLRACDTFKPALCPTLLGRKLYDGLLDTGTDSLGLLQSQRIGLRMTQRLAYGLATGCFGGSSSATVPAHDVATEYQ